MTDGSVERFWAALKRERRAVAADIGPAPPAYRSVDSGYGLHSRPVWRGLTGWSIQSAPSPRVSERVNALNAIFQSNNGNGDPSVVVDPRLAPTTVRALAGEYRWKLKRDTSGAMSSVDGELDKANRPFADVGDALGYLVMGAGVHAHLVDVAKPRRENATIGGFDDSDWEV